jgi:hypothetical protein
VADEARGGPGPTREDERERLERQASVAEWVTIGWNVFEMVITIGLGVAARSLALVALTR